MTKSLKQNIFQEGKPQMVHDKPRQAMESKLAEIGERGIVTKAARNLVNLQKDYLTFLESFMNLANNYLRHITNNPREIKENCDSLLKIYRRYENSDMLLLLKYAEMIYPQNFSYVSKSKQKSKN